MDKVCVCTCSLAKSWTHLPRTLDDYDFIKGEKYEFGVGSSDYVVHKKGHNIGLAYRSFSESAFHKYFMTIEDYREFKINQIIEDE